MGIIGALRTERQFRSQKESHAGDVRGIPPFKSEGLIGPRPILR